MWPAEIQAVSDGCLTKRNSCHHDLALVLLKPPLRLPPVISVHLGMVQGHTSRQGAAGLVQEACNLNHVCGHLLWIFDAWI